MRFCVKCGQAHNHKALDLLALLFCRKCREREFAAEYFLEDELHEHLRKGKELVLK